MAFSGPVLLKRIPNDPQQRKLLRYADYVATGRFRRFDRFFKGLHAAFKVFVNARFFRPCAYRQGQRSVLGKPAWTGT